jgi:glycosyltransferase involved in cell wall biosynthesis
MADLTVLGQDPRFAGGACAQMEAFLDAARALGRDPELVYVAHPTFDGRTWTPDRLEVVRLRRHPPRLGRPLWVVATTAQHGAAATGEYDVWVGTSLADEWRGRVAYLSRTQRLAHALNARSLQAIERRILRGARRVFATSAWSRHTVAEASGRDDVGILPLPVDVDAFTPEDEETWLARNPVVAFVGRADDPRKNVRLLLDAAALLPEVRIRLIGDPPRGPLPPNVDALGRVASVAEHLRTARLCVVPARQEGFGIAAAEALAAGVPVVATRSGGPEELLERSGGGRLLDGWSPEELAAMVDGLLADAATLAALRRRGREYVVREHSPARLRERLAEVLD